MKHESRILVSLCRKGVCASFIVRGSSIDGFVAGRSCEDLVRRLEDLGYIHEIRYSIGECTAGFPEPPGRLRERSKRYYVLLDRVLGEVEALISEIKYLNLQLLSRP